MSSKNHNSTLYSTIDIIKSYMSNKNTVDKTVAIATIMDERRGTFHVKSHYQPNTRKRDVLIILYVFNLCIIQLAQLFMNHKTTNSKKERRGWGHVILKEAFYYPLEQARQ